MRWLVEEFHKAEKTGCNVETRRLEHVDRLEPLIGLLSVLAVWLLELKFVARDEPERPARELFDPIAVGAMAKYLRCSAKRLSVSQFWSGVGRLGGHPGRKRDGPIGWLRAWRGWQSFQLILLGATLATDGQDVGNSKTRSPWQLRCALRAKSAVQYTVQGRRANLSGPVSAIFTVNFGKAPGKTAAMVATVTTQAARPDVWNVEIPAARGNGKFARAKR